MRLKLFLLVVLAGGWSCRSMYDRPHSGPQNHAFAPDSVTVLPQNEILLEGRIFARETGEPVIFGTVALYREGILITGREADFDGLFSLQGVLEPGSSYELELSYVGLRPVRISFGNLERGRRFYLEIPMEQGEPAFLCPGPSYFEVPLLEMDNTSSGATYSSEMLRKMPAFSGGG